MSLSRPYSAGFCGFATANRAIFGASLPTHAEIARDSADMMGAPEAVLAWGGLGANSERMALTATPANACSNCVFRYPSQCSWPGTVPTAPAALSVKPCPSRPYAQGIADLSVNSQRGLPVRKSVASSRRTNKGTRGKSRCEFSRLQRSHVSPLAAWRPVVTRRLNRVCLAPVPALAQPLLLAAMPKPQPSSARVPMCSTARLTQVAATDLTAATLGSQPLNTATKAVCGSGGFLLPKPLRVSRRGHEPEGTFDVQ